MRLYHHVPLCLTEWGLYPFVTHLCYLRRGLLLFHRPPQQEVCRVPSHADIMDQAVLRNAHICLLLPQQVDMV